MRFSFFYLAPADKLTNYLSTLSSLKSLSAARVESLSLISSLTCVFSFFCTEWVVAESSAHVQYFPLDNIAVESKIKVQMGFSDVNITLRALDELSHPNHHWNERISYSNVDTDFDSLVRQYKPVSLLLHLRHFLF